MNFKVGMLVVLVILTHINFLFAKERDNWELKVETVGQNSLAIYSSNCSYIYEIGDETGYMCDINAMLIERKKDFCELSNLLLAGDKNIAIRKKGEDFIAVYKSDAYIDEKNKSLLRQEDIEFKVYKDKLGWKTKGVWSIKKKGSSKEFPCKTYNLNPVKLPN